MCIAGYCSLNFLLQCVTMTHYFVSETWSWSLVRAIHAEFAWCDSSDPLMQSVQSNLFSFYFFFLFNIFVSGKQWIILLITCEEFISV